MFREIGKDKYKFVGELPNARTQPHTWYEGAW